MAEYANDPIENSKTQPMDKAILNKYYRKTCGDLAAMLIRGMARKMVSPETVDARLGNAKGHTMRYINSLILGKVTTFKNLTDIACVLDTELIFDSKDIEPIRSKAVRFSDGGFDRSRYHYINDKFDETPLPADPSQMVEVMDKDLNLVLAPTGVVNWEEVVCWTTIIFVDDEKVPTTPPVE